MPDTMKPREPGEDGSMQGQIKTPMCSENVQSKGEGKVHSFKKATGDIDKSGGKGNSIEGPGMKGEWTGGINIKGSNRRY